MSLDLAATGRSAPDAPGRTAALAILLVGNYVHDRQQSMQRFSEVLRAQLAARGHRVALIQPEPWFGRLRPSGRGLGKWLGYADKFWRFPAQLRRAAATVDVVHICDHSNAMYCHQLLGRPHLVTCHDLLAVRSALGEIPENPVRWSGRRLQAMVLGGLKVARRIACISSATLSDVERLTAAGRCALVTNGINHPYRPLPDDQVRRELGNLDLVEDAPYLLHVGSNAWYKNRAGLLRIVADLTRREAGRQLRLVIAGQRLTRELTDLAMQLGIGERVSEVGEVDNDQLNALYCGAAGLLFPSLAEGFGWPIIEAQAAGCPVFASNRAPLDEIGGDAAVAIDPTDAAAAGAAIAAALPRRDELRRRGLANAARYTTAAMIDGYERLYRELAVSG